MVRERTGLVIDPYFSATKIEWLLRNAELDGAVFGTIDAWLAFKLTGRHVTDLSNASRTMLFDIRELRWDPELCELFGVDPAALPEPAASAEVYGETSVFGGSVPVAGIAGRPAGGALRPGLLLARRGQEHLRHGQLRSAERRRAAAGGDRGTAVDRRLGNRQRQPRHLRARGVGVRDRRRGAVASRRPRRHLRRGGDRGAGRLARVQRRRLLRSGADRTRLAALGSLRARDDRRADARDRPRPPRSRRRSSRSPTRRSMRCGRRRRRPARRSRRSRPTAAPCGNAWLMQFQADVLGAPVIVPEVAETTALGAAYLAGVATGVWDLAGPQGNVARAGGLRARDVRGRARGAAGAMGRGRGAFSRLGGGVTVLSRKWVGVG